MNKIPFRFILLVLYCMPVFLQAAGGHGHAPSADTTVLPLSLSDYEAEEAELGIDSLGGRLVHRIKKTPFNLVASLIFLMAIIHTFMSSKFQKIAHDIEHRHKEEQQKKKRELGEENNGSFKEETSFSATVFHFLGEIEAIFGIWCIPLVVTILGFYGWGSAVNYIDNVVNYTEPMFVVIIMAISSTRPVLKFSERVLGKIAGIGGRTPQAWWYSILVVAPLLGSFITEPAAMTIAALLLAKTIYSLEPSTKFKYGTLGLLFVNISVGGTLTHFAAPPVLMVAGKWNWDIAFMFTHFGWKAFLGILVATAVYGFFLKDEFKILNQKASELELKRKGAEEDKIPIWITLVVLLFMAWTVFNLHNPPLFIAGFLFFMAFVQATATHQDDVRIKGPILVGFFLAGLVTHGPLQQWWIAPVLSQLGELSLFTGSTILTAFNDNAAITFLASQVPAFDPSAGASAVVKQYAVVAGAVTGGGLTVIANAPNPAGQSLLNKYFKDGVSPAKLFISALFPTIVMAFAFMLFR